MNRILKLATRFEKICAEDDSEDMQMYVSDESFLKIYKEEIKGMLDRLNWNGKPFTIILQVKGNHIEPAEGGPEYEDDYEDTRLN